MERKIVSFSELSTFDSCGLKHFYRYHMRLEARDYMERIHLVIGTLYHEAERLVYEEGWPKEKKPDQKRIAEAVEKVAEPFEKEFDSPYGEPYFNKDQFEADKHIARHLVNVFLTRLYVDEPYTFVEAERKVQTSIGDIGFIGYIDRIYEKDGDILLGEKKTRGHSWGSKLERIVPEDLQVNIYMADQIDQGHDVKGVVYDVLKKPDSSVVMSTNFSSHKEHIEAIDAHYKKVRKPFKRAEVRFDLDRKALESKVKKMVAGINKFYKKPYTSAAAAEKPSGPNSWPCAYCEYKGICHHGQPIDSTFKYKPHNRHVVL